MNEIFKWSGGRPYGLQKPDGTCDSSIGKMELNSEADIILSAANLSRAAPTEWEAFVKALQRRAKEAAEQLVGSEQTYLQVNQGRAQAYAFLYRTCATCKEQQDKMGSKK